MPDFEQPLKRVRANNIVQAIWAFHADKLEAAATARANPHRGAVDRVLGQAGLGIAGFFESNVISEALVTQKAPPAKAVAVRLFC